MPSNADYTREYFQIIDELDGDIESRRAAFNYMQDSTAIVHHQVVASSFVPRLFNRIVDGIMGKVRKAGGVKQALFNRAVEAKVGAGARREA